MLQCWRDIREEKSEATLVEWLTDLYDQMLSTWHKQVDHSHPSKHIYYVGTTSSMLVQHCTCINVIKLFLRLLGYHQPKFWLQHFANVSTFTTSQMLEKNSQDMKHSACLILVSVTDSGPTLNQHLIDVSLCWLGTHSFCSVMMT